MNPVSPEDIARIARRLEPLETRMVFLGGAIVPFLLDHPGLTANPLRTYIADSMAAYVSNEAFLECLSGHLPPDTASQQRLPGLIEKINAIGAIISEGNTRAT